MFAKQVMGVYAAVLTPRREDNSIDLSALTRLIQFQIAQGISSYAINGATGECCLTTPEELRLILSTVRQITDGRAQILCGIGAPGTQLAKELAAVAQEQQVQGLLLPMPYFFSYQQQDLDLFCREVAASTTLPILLYNLPQFASGLEKDTVLTLISEVPNIIGIKDSSGSLEILGHLTQHAPHSCRIVGNDSALAAALEQHLCDGVVSGVAGVLPEAIIALYAERDSLSSDAFRVAVLRVEEFIEQINQFPTPWGLKFIAEIRGIFVPHFAQPVSSQRLQQARHMADWFTHWSPSSLPTGTVAR